MVIEPTEVVESGPVKLTLRKIEKGGLISYARPGVRASLYFNKTMFGPGVPPKHLILTADGLTPAVEKMAPVKKVAKKATKAAKKATKAAKKATKAAKKPRRKSKV